MGYFTSAVAGLAGCLAAVAQPTSQVCAGRAANGGGLCADLRLLAGDSLVWRPVLAATLSHPGRAIFATARLASSEARNSRSAATLAAAGRGPADRLQPVGSNQCHQPSLGGLRQRATAGSRWPRRMGRWTQSAALVALGGHPRAVGGIAAGFRLAATAGPVLAPAVWRVSHVRAVANPAPVAQAGRRSVAPGPPA